MAAEKQKSTPNHYAKRISNDEIEMRLPWPPSVNHYWGREIMLPALSSIMSMVGTSGFYRWLKKNSRAKEYLTSEAKTFREHVGWIVHTGRCGMGWKQPVSMSLIVYPPDRRIRDLSNLYKALEDALEHANVFVNDSQVVEHHSAKSDLVMKGGELYVVVKQLPPRKKTK